ncbi:anthranilate synthase component II [Nocardioides massiliensis]|uniref:anthranilate synthase component II n=1 Tax=Nocardioides massiliensis TaxID=1325935 RepID=UPI000A99E214|nr:aminodeoxychorismate/anthranilate synthase component II [Nocardioides massiliensis]
MLVVDHHDSYTHNLLHLLAEVTGRLPDLVQHDTVAVDAVLAGDWTHLVLSPGPGSPAVADDFAVGERILREARVPVLGVCLGMQGLVTAYGGRVDRARPAHGEVAAITHDDTGIFAGLPQGFAAVRYHSLAALDLPAEVEACAWAEEPDGSRVVMGVRHRTRPLHGVQFHPESILTEHGARIIAAFLELA